MGGKHKHAQRTKNNARPSSSGRSAELLGNSVPNFVGFSSVKDSGYVPAMPSFSGILNDESAANLDSNFQLVLKKMNKKDAVTKLKALVEFSELVSASQPDTVKTILPFWPRLYTLLAVDVDHKVRTASHQAHQEVILKVKKNLAPYLKQLAGPWFTSQYDTYPPAATAATQSFEAAFPPNKVQEAIVFCQEEILNYICDNITVQTLLTVYNPPITTPEEAEAKYERLLTASLQGYTLYLNKLSADQLKTAEEYNLRIITSSKFWKLSKYKIPIVRASWFGCITALCQNAAFLLKNEKAHVTTTVFNNLDEVEPMVVPPTWEAALLVVSNIEEWWKFVNVEKLVLPKLWKVLKEGGLGNACVVFPNILPFISHFPKTMDINEIYRHFFENIRIGLQKRQVLQSRLEFNAIATTMIECIKYIIMKNATESKLCESLITDHLIPVVDWCLNDDNSITKVVFIEISTLLQFWARNSNVKEFKNYNNYIQMFWRSIEGIFDDSLSKCEQSNEKEKFITVAKKQIEFLLCLQKYNTLKTKKQAKVSFEVPTAKSDVTDSTASVNTSPGTYHIELDSLVHKTCALYLKYIEENHRYELADYFCSLVQNFSSTDLFKYLNNQLNDVEGLNLIYVYRNLFLKYLQHENIASQNIVDIVFILYNFLDHDGKNEILESFTQMSNVNCLRWSIAKGLSHPYCYDATIRKWLSHQNVTDLLIKIASSMLMDEISTEETLLLKQALQQNINGDLLISEEACKKIMVIFCNALILPQKYPLTINICASFAAQMSAILYTEKTLLSYGDQLVLSLFLMSCKINYDPDTISKDTLWEVSTAWQDVVMILTSEKLTPEFDIITVKCMKVIQNELLRDCSTEKMNQMVNVTTDLIKAVMSSGDSFGRKTNFIATLLNVPEVMRAEIKKLNDMFVSTEMILGDISWPKENPFDTIDCTQIIHMYPCVIWCRFVVNVLTRLFRKNIVVKQDEDEEQEEEDAILSESTSDTDKLILDLLYFNTSSKTFILNCKNSSVYYKLSLENVIFSKDLHTFIKYILPTEILDAIIDKIDPNQIDVMGAQMLFDLHKHLLDKHNLEETYLKLIRPITDEALYLQCTQIFADHVPRDEVIRRDTPMKLIITTRALLSYRRIEEQLAAAMALLKDIQQTKVDVLLYNKDISNEKWEDLQFVVEIIRLLEKLIVDKYLTLTPDQWDFIILSLTAWVDSVEKSKTKYKEMKTATFICAVSKLYTTFHKFIYTEESTSMISGACSNFIIEFVDCFAQDVHIALLKTWMYISEQELLTQDDFYVSRTPFLQIFGKIIFHLESKYLIKEDEKQLPNWQSIWQLCNNLLESSVNVLQLYGYHCLKQIINKLISIDANSLDHNIPQKYGLMCSQLEKLLISVQDVVQIMLMDFKLGEDTCRVEPFTDSYRFTFGYVLIWDILLTFCQLASTDLRYQYSDWIRSGDYFKNLLNNMFRLMPTEVLHCGEIKKPNVSLLFTVPPSLGFTELPSSVYLEHMVCWLYGRSLSNLPALVRQWWSDNDTRLSQIIEQVTTMNVSPMLCTQELQDVMDREHKNMKVRVHQTAREVIATYVVDDARMELIISLPINYPLGVVQVDCSKQFGGTAQWRNWVMQLTIFLTHQNGRIWEGLSLWKSNLDKRFDGVEECYICFSVLHNATYQLPKLVCQTCKKKFHSPCLYKWFSTSNKSTCPICRNLF